MVVNDLLLRRRGRGKMTGENFGFFAHNISTRNKILLLLAFGTLAVASVAPRRAASVFKSCITSIWKKLSLKNTQRQQRDNDNNHRNKNTSGSILDADDEETASSSIEGSNHSIEYANSMRRPALDSSNGADVDTTDKASDAGSSSGSTGSPKPEMEGPATPDLMPRSYNNRDDLSDIRSPQLTLSPSLVEEALPIIFGQRHRPRGHDSDTQTSFEVY